MASGSLAGTKVDFRWGGGLAVWLTVDDTPRHTDGGATQVHMPREPGEASEIGTWIDSWQNLTTAKLNWWHQPRKSKLYRVGVLIGCDRSHSPFRVRDRSIDSLSELLSY